FRGEEPTGYDMPRIHLNTKNTTRFMGNDLTETATLVARAVYPGTTEATTPDLIIFYDDANWRSGLAATSLLRPLNALLLPASAADSLPADFVIRGSDSFGGAQALLIDGATVEAERFTTRAIASADIPALLEESGAAPRHAILVDGDDPGTAVLAAPWATYSGDLIAFDDAVDLADLSATYPTYVLGAAEADEEFILARIGGTNPHATAVAFAAYENEARYEDEIEGGSRTGELFFGWGFNADSLTGYRGFNIAPEGEPGMGLLSANLARRGKPGPLFWTPQEELPQGVYNYFFSQRAAFWVTPSEGPFHHFYLLGDTEAISFPAQGEADYAVEIGPYFQKGVGAGPLDMLAAAWVLIGVASALWIAVHESRFLPYQNWLMSLAWPLLALMIGPFGILFYRLAYSRPIIKKKQPNGKMMIMWDRPLWLQGLVATASAVGFGAMIMIFTGYLVTLFGMPLIPMTNYAFLLGTPMILIMIINYVAAVLIAWPLFQAPMMAVMYDVPYRKALRIAFPLVAASMAAAAVGMNPSMWWFMMSKIPMMPTEESILWFGTMFVTAFVAFLLAWPLNYYFVRTQRKAGLM
ncbi:MAG: DUF4396 domain-containing protein, partial [Candidatus Promineifilaceae bacterium]|nr:DUF4396 domain-containing protein [Candidatus Promineifilaceae bacterium]